MALIQGVVLRPRDRDWLALHPNQLGVQGHAAVSHERPLVQEDQLLGLQAKKGESGARLVFRWLENVVAKDVPERHEEERLTLTPEPANQHDDLPILAAPIAEPDYITDYSAKRIAVSVSKHGAIRKPNTGTEDRRLVGVLWSCRNRALFVGFDIVILVAE